MKTCRKKSHNSSFAQDVRKWHETKLDDGVNIPRKLNIKKKVSSQANFSIVRVLCEIFTQLTINYKHKFQAVALQVFSLRSSQFFFFFHCENEFSSHNGIEIFFVYTWQRPFVLHLRGFNLIEICAWLLCYMTLSYPFY